MIVPDGIAGSILLAPDGGNRPFARRVRVRPGLPDEENARRIIAAAEKGYRKRKRQAEKQSKRTEMKLGGPIERKSKLKPIRRDRKAKRFEEDFGGKDRALWGKARPCDTCGAPPPSQNSHVLSRGGRLGKGQEVISQCQGCHDRITKMDTADLLAIAARVYRKWLAQGGHELESGLEAHGEAR
jgi:hypothetical protein